MPANVRHVVREHDELTDDLRRGGTVQELDALGDSVELVGHDPHRRPLLDGVAEGYDLTADRRARGGGRSDRRRAGGGGAAPADDRIRPPAPSPSSR